MGGGGSSGSAGGGASAYQVPDYIKQAHKAIMGGPDEVYPIAVRSQEGAVWAAAQAQRANPYEGKSAYDPESYLLSSQARFDDYLAYLISLDPDNIWHDYRDKVRLELGIEDLDWSTVTDIVVGKADSVTLSEELIRERVDAFDEHMTAVKTNTRTRYNGLMADIGAVMSSAFTLGNAMLEQEHTRQVSSFEAELRMQNWVQRIEYIKQSVKDYILVKFTGIDYLGKGMAEYMSLLDMRLRYEHNATQLQGDLNRIAIVANKEETDRNLEIEDHEGRWKMECWQYAANVISAHGAATAVYKGKSSSNEGGSNLGGALSGALSGAGLGAILGSSGALASIGITGAGSGAALGAIAGAAMAFI